jgi:hypothetical protein
LFVHDKAGQGGVEVKSGKKGCYSLKLPGHDFRLKNYSKQSWKLVRVRSFDAARTGRSDQEPLKGTPLLPFIMEVDETEVLETSMRPLTRTREL